MKPNRGSHLHHQHGVCNYLWNTPNMLRTPSLSLSFVRADRGLQHTVNKRNSTRSTVQTHIHPHTHTRARARASASFGIYMRVQCRLPASDGRVYRRLLVQIQQQPPSLSAVSPPSARTLLACLLASECSCCTCKSSTRFMSMMQDATLRWEKANAAAHASATLAPLFPDTHLKHSKCNMCAQHTSLQRQHSHLARCTTEALRLHQSFDCLPGRCI